MNIYGLLCLITLIGINISIYYIATRKNQTKTVFLLISLFSAFIMGATFLFELSADDMKGATRALYAQFIGYTPFFVFFIFETFRACGYKIKPQYIKGSIVYCVLIFTIIFTNDRHGLYYSKFYFTTLESGSNVLTYDHGIIGKINYLFTYVAIFIATANILIHYSKWNKTLKKQLNYFLIGIGVSVGIHLLSIVGILKSSYSLTYYEFAITVLIYTYGLYKKGILDVEASAINMSLRSIKNEIFVLDKHWNFVYANETAKLKDDVIDNLLQGDTIEKIQILPSYLKELHDVGVYEYDYLYNGERRYMQCTINALIEKKRTIGYILYCDDRTEIKNNLIEAETKAYTDPLVKVYNRRGFFNRLDSLANKQLKSTGLLLIDIDHFKNVNDTYGHDIGDVVLVNLCEILKECVCTQDVVARYGGEEFIVAIIDSNLKAVLRKAEEIRKCVEEHTFEKVGKITISIGVSMYDNNRIINELIKKADEALYKAKETSRNAVFYYDTDNEIKAYTDVKNRNKIKSDFSELQKVLTLMPFKTVIWTMNNEFVGASNSFINMLKTDVETYKKNPSKFDFKTEKNEEFKEGILKSIKNLNEGEVLEKQWNYLSSDGEVISTTVSIAKVYYLKEYIIIADIRN